MAPSASGHLLVSKGVRLIRFAVERATRVLRDKIPQISQPLESQADPIYVRVSTRQPINRLAAIRQTQSRWFSSKAISDTANRYFSTSARQASKPLRSAYPQSRTATAVSRITSRAPFASTLRPNLTGGTLCRSAGGYNLGAGRVGGVRSFSHVPAAPAEVIQNVSQAVRAFWLSGQKARFDGFHPRTGEKRYRAVSENQDKARHNLESYRTDAAGSFVDFKVNPTITAIGPLSGVRRTTTASSTCDRDTETVETLCQPALISSLEADFARALKDLAAIMNDLKHLSTLGSLPVELVNPNTLRVRFPGCDRDTVENLCTELNIRRGIVGQDDNFDNQCGVEMALLFPFAPSRATSDKFGEVVFDSDDYRPAKKTKRDCVDWAAMLSPSNSDLPGSSRQTITSHDLDAEMVENPWLSSLSGCSSLRASDEAYEVAAMFFQPPPASKQYTAGKAQSTEYEGLEGIYKFLGECERVRV